MAYIGGGTLLFFLSMSAGSASNQTLTVLAFFTRAFEMMGSCVTWVSTAEILTTEIRTTGHSAANAMGRTGAFMSPYLTGTLPLKSVGAIMLVIHLLTACAAYNLPESKGRDLGRTSLEDVKPDDGQGEGSEMAFHYEDSDKPKPQASSTGIV